MDAALAGPDGIPSTDAAEHPLLRAARERVLPGLLLSTASVGVGFVDRDLRYVRVNDALAEMNGLPAARHAGRHLRDVLAPEAARVVEALLTRVMETGEAVRDVEVNGQSFGADVSFLVNYWPVHGAGGETLGVAAMVAETTDRRRAVEERAARERTEELSRLLVEASDLLASSLDFRATLPAVARRVVPLLADGCLVDVVDEDGTIRRVAVAHADPAREAVAQRIAALHPPVAGGPGPVARVVASGRPERKEDVSDADLAAAARGDAHLELLRELGIRSYACAPLVARGGTLGAVTLLAGGDRGRFSAADLAMASELARRAAQAVDNARLYAAEQRARRRAERLQEVAVALSEAVTRQQVAEVMMARGVVAMGACAGVAALRVEDGAEVEILASLGYVACMTAGERWPLDAPLPVAEATRSAEAVFVDSAGAWQERYGAPAPAGGPARAWAALPLVLDGPPRGALLWSFDHERAFTEEERGFLLALTRQCAVALERARLHEAERAARAEAEAANLAKSQFLAVMSHELRTPLNAIGGYVELIEMGIRGPVTEQQREDLRRIQKSQLHLLGLINEVLNYARIETGS